MLLITGISSEKTKQLIIYGIFCRNVTTFYQQELTFLFQVQEKLKEYRKSKLNFSSSSFIADDNHVKIVWLHEVVSIKHDILYF